MKFYALFKSEDAAYQPELIAVSNDLVKLRSLGHSNKWSVGSPDVTNSPSVKAYVEPATGPRYWITEVPGVV
jgi:hypothetical protein